LEFAENPYRFATNIKQRCHPPDFRE
jgi:hypothetical protein